jgi:periplasmic divalent cation tolerance protein
MPDNHPMPQIVLTTARDLDEANRLARVLVEEHLAACVSFIPSVQSVYRWQGNVESATEVLMLIKSGPDQLAALESRLLELHSYETPEFLVLHVESASHRYLDWLHASLQPESGSWAEPV